jgi:hypothetical protein
MNAGELDDAITLLGEVARNFLDMPGKSAESLHAGALCVVVQSYLVELARHLVDGMEPFDAYEATATGTLKLPDSAAATLFKVVSARPSR